MAEIPHLNKETWKYAIGGGLASVPFSIGFYWVAAMGDTFVTFPIVFAGILAGYLAQKNSRDPIPTGMVAGIVGSVPAYLWIFPQLIQTATGFADAWASPLGAAVVIVFSISLFILAPTLPGLMGGFFGGWLAKRTGTDQAAAVGS